MSQHPSIPPAASAAMEAPEVQRVLWRLAREIQEGHPGGGDVCLCGIVTRGVYLADRLRRLIAEQGGTEWRAVALDVGPYRDDGARPAWQGASEAPLPRADRSSVDGLDVILIDDVLYHGRTARAALVALAQLGRPRSVELLVMVDRGHRELPVRATYVGKNMSTSVDQRVSVHLLACDGEDAIRLHPQSARDRS